MIPNIDIFGLGMTTIVYGEYNGRLIVAVEDCWMVELVEHLADIT